MRIFKPLENPDSYHWIKILHVGSLIAVWWPWGKDETSDDMAYPLVGLRLWKNTTTHWAVIIGCTTYFNTRLNFE